MTDNLNVALKLSVDKKEGESNLQAFNRSFDSAMTGINKSGADVDAFRKIATDINEGKVSVEDLDAETQQLYKTYKEGAQLAASRDILGIKAHVEIQKEIDETKQAYDQLKKSGKLSQTELAQAAIKTEDRIRKLKSETNGWTESLENAKGSIAGLVAAGAGLAVMTGEAIEFESAMADVKKVVGGTEGQMESLGTQIKQLSTELPISADGLAQIAAAGGQLGVPIEKLGEFIDLSAKMSVAFDISAEQAGQAVAKLSNIFNIPIDDIESLGDAINVLGNTTAAKEADIVNVLTRIGGSASQFKLTAEQSAALAATFISMGATSEVAGTGINALLSKLQTANVQGPQFQQALAEMGLSANQLGEDIRANPQEALNSFLRTLSELDDQSRAETLTRLFGQEYQDDIARLLNGLDKYDESLARITDTGTTAGAMQDEFSARIETTEAQIQLLKNGLEVVAINLGSIFLPAVREMAEGLGDATAAVAEFIEAYPSIAGIATVLGTAAASVGALRIGMLSMRYVGVKAFGDITAQIATANLSMKALQLQAGKTAAAFTVAGAATAAAWVGMDIGTALREEFEIVEKLGIEVAAAFTQLAAIAKFAWDVIADPSEASGAYDALLAELDQVQTVYGKMYTEVGKVNTQQKVAQTTAQELATALNTVGKEGTQAAGNIEAAFNKLDLTTPKGITDLTAAIDLAGSKVGLLDKKVEGWIAKANATDLNNFKNQLKTAFNEGQLSAEQLEKYNNDILSASFQKLGIVAETALGQISPAAEEAIGNLKIIQQTLSDSSLDGVTKMRALEIAIKGALANADTTAAVDALAKEINYLADSGQLSAVQLARLNQELEKQKQLTTESLPGIQSVEEGMKQLGLTSQAEMKKSAEEMKNVFSQLEAMKAPLPDLEAAFLRYAEAAIAANDGVITTAIQTKAAMLGVSDEVEAMGTSVETAGEKSKAGLDKVTESAKQTADELENVADGARKSSRDVKAVAAELSSFFDGVKNSVYELSAAAGAAFSNKLGVNVQPVLDDIDSLQLAIDQAAVNSGNLIRDNVLVFDATGINKFENEVIAASDSVVAAYSSQKIKFLEYLDAIESGEGVNESFLNSAEASIGSMNLLGEEDLSQLRSALDSANKKLVQMNTNAQNTLAGLQDELDALQGNQDAIDQRDYDRKRAELNAALEEARMYGNREAINSYTEALRVLDEVRRENNAQSGGSVRGGGGGSGSSASSSQNHTTITLKSPDGISNVTLNGNAGSLNSLLDVLQDAGLRSS
tara:strand:+ start:22816 stop:26613 length:3798 start_codon:yes stop_codon:yes gene_type:complete